MGDHGYGDGDFPWSTDPSSASASASASASDSPSDVEILQRVWRNEKAAPEILPFQKLLVERVREQIHLMVLLFPVHFLRHFTSY
jgi:hypothetical protein